MLGQLSADGAEGPVALGGPRQRRLLALLLLHRNCVVSVDLLAEVVFDGALPAPAPTTLRSSVCRLRRSLQPLGLAVRRQPCGYRLDLPDGVLDSARMEVLADRARSAAAAGQHTSTARLARSALGLWRGRPFAELADEPWVAPEVARLTGVRDDLRELLVDSELALERPHRALGLVAQMTQEDPFRESWRGRQMLALYRVGRVSEALEVYREVRCLLRDELGLDPSHALEELHERVLARSPDLDAASGAWTPETTRVHRAAT